MRILLVASATQTSKTGVTAHYNRLLAHLSGRVDDVQLITPADTPVVAKKVLGAFRRVAALFGPNGQVLYLELENFLSIWVSIRWKGTRSFDFVHAQDVTAGAAAARALPRTRKDRVAVTCHFNDDPLTEYRDQYTINDWTHRQLARWYRFLFRQLGSFITVSDYTKRASAFLRPKHAACTVIHNGVTFEQKTDRPDNGLFTIVNIGTIETRKNQRLLIDAAAELRNRGFPRFQVWLLGDGPKRTEWQALIQEKNLEGYVSFLGYQLDPTDFLQRASLYVHTARNESWGYTITEAMATGTPVLALATGGIPEQFDMHHRGLLPAQTTASELADAILRYHSSDARRQLASQQWKYARDRFRLDIMIDKHIAFYRAAIGRQQTIPAQKPLIEA